MNKVGNWVLEEFVPCDLPKEVASGFTQIMNEIVGVKYTPLLYTATQIVAGKNHMIICESAPVVMNTVRGLAAVYLHQALPTEGGAFQLFSVEPISIGI